MIAVRKPRVYLAGKIAKKGWRQEIADLRRVPPEAALNPNFELDCGAFIMTGPFLISCDHGCSHGPGTHGAGIGCIEDLNEPIRRRRRRIHTLSFQRIARADGVFAYIDAADCYGTLVELGYAHALGKPVVIVADGLSRKEIDELWFARQCATAILRGSPHETFETALRSFHTGGEKSRREVSAAHEQRE
jgi:Nucleoside 2-deoxyribosyltransferase